MDEKEQIINILRSLKPALQDRYKIRDAALFGSFVRGEQNPNSDVDLLVEFEEDADLLDLVALEQFLEQQLHRKVDVGTTNSLRNEIRDRITKEAAPV